MRKLFKYVLYVGFAMALTTSAVWTSERLQSFFVKRYCYINYGGVPKRVDDCICECAPEDRIKGGHWCKRCEHYVHSDEVYVPVPKDRRKPRR
jgi:hypothetical protein